MTMPFGLGRIPAVEPPRQETVQCPIEGCTVMFTSGDELAYAEHQMTHHAAGSHMSVDATAALSASV